MFLGSERFVAEVPRFYLNENDSTSAHDGTRENPFTSLPEAYAKIGDKSAELILLGSNITLNTVLELSYRADYIIRYFNLLI